MKQRRHLTAFLLKSKARSAGPPLHRQLDARRFGHLCDYIFGAGTVIDPLPLQGNLNSTFYQNDRDALLSDWQAVGNDMQGAITAYHIVAHSEGDGDDEASAETNPSAVFYHAPNRKHHVS